MNPNQTVIMTHPLPEAWIQDLASKVHLVIGDDNATGISPSLLPYLGEATGIITLLCDKLDRSILEQMPNLRIVCNYAGGVDNIDVAACTQRKIPVGYTPGILTDATADLSMALLLAVARNLPKAASDAQAGNWKMWHPASWLGMELNGAVLGIFGLGKIGLAVGKRARAFGMTVIYHNRSRNLQAEHELGAEYVSFEDLLKRSDVLSIHAPNNELSAGKFNAEAFKSMKNTAIFINTGRGQIVDMEALTLALRSGWIKAAGLDVTTPEPLPTDHPLFKMENCLILPHIGSASEQTRINMAKITIENMLAGLEGNRLPYCVNPEVY